MKFDRGSGNASKYTSCEFEGGTCSRSKAAAAEVKTAILDALRMAKYSGGMNALQWQPHLQN